MTQPHLAVDTNLLLLYLIGSVDIEQVGQHKRLKTYVRDDFLLLVEYLNGRDLVTTPNILTETSNLMAQSLSDRYRDKVRTEFRMLVSEMSETYIPSSLATQAVEFHWLGLTDCVAISLSADEVELLTDDLDLFGVALGRGMPATNFNRLRDAHLSA